MKERLMVHGILYLPSTTTLNDFGIKFKIVSLLRDNESAINLTNNPVQHTITKHIYVYNHFIRDHQQKGTFALRVWAPKIN
jgi:hypothetical protein